MLNIISVPDEELFDSVREMITERIQHSRRDLCLRFANIVMANIPPDDLEDMTDKDLYGSVVSFFNFVEERGSPSKLRVINPSFEHHGWHSRHTAIETVNLDMPFIIDSLMGLLQSKRVAVHMMLHPVVAAERDESGRLTRIFSLSDELPEDVIWESHIHIQITQQAKEEKLQLLSTELNEVITHVTQVVDDYASMRGRVKETTEFSAGLVKLLGEDEVSDTVDFVTWISTSNFVLTGIRDYSLSGKGDQLSLEPVADTSMGIFRERDYEVFYGFQGGSVNMPPDVIEFILSSKVLLVNKANRSSLVHRQVHIDAIFVKLFDKKGKVTGLRLICGLYTASAYTGSARDIPLLRKKIQEIMVRSGVRSDSYDGRKLLNIVESYPRDELMQISVDDLLRNVIGIAQLRGRERVAIFIRRDPFGRFVTCLTYLPRDSFNTINRMKFQTILGESFQGDVVAHQVLTATDERMARLMFIIKTEPDKPVVAVDLKEVEQRMSDVIRSWYGELQQALSATWGEGRGQELMERYGSSFPASYREEFSSQTAVYDIRRVEQVEETGTLSIQLYRPLEAERESVYLKLISRGRPLPLSDVLPVLENLGLRVIMENPFLLDLGEDRPKISMHQYRMTLSSKEIVDLDIVRAPFEETLAKIWEGKVEQDPFNRLILVAELNWREVVLLRALARFMRQTGLPFTDSYISKALANNVEITRKLVTLFQESFDPEHDRRNVSDDTDSGVRLIEERLENVESLDDDRILRRYLNAITSMVRSNYFQYDENNEQKSHISFKFDSRKLVELPEPRPMYEIWVYSPQVEAVHLRGGKVARGGLRWSDRREDFRTEVLGLIKAQMVKNAVIVPVGSKGGFVVKRPPTEGGREAFLAEGVRCYQTMINGMLDLTDNLVGDDIVPPERTVRYDEDDPYLVVAADKGTATFSDISNDISVERGFWLGDAFASGGSAGYDHKKMGITARGGWESVKRHFLEFGTDVQSEPFTVIGVGDMAGDVFGNGMLNSRYIRLIAAFNHMHIFIDPDPDPASSFTERKRMFELPRSSWEDYDKKLISAGGGVFERSSKRLTVTPQIKELFGLDQARVTPNALIRRILQTNVDLLWFGGIGTYIKARGEGHVDVGDRANDSIRVDPDEVGARVIGEGANLGVTQRGRIEFALRGGRINTDAVDNSAGVDCSDHEVNIKILLQGVVGASEMTTKQRNILLEEMTEEVGELVLEDNYRQTQSISLVERMGSALIPTQARYMRHLERAGQLNRAIEFLPDEEVMTQRIVERIGLTRPELSVLMAYAKIVSYEELLRSDVPDDPALEGDLLEYFPTQLRERFPDRIKRHRLRREIITTIITNRLINRLGTTFVSTARERSGRAPSEIARAFVLSVEILGLKDLWLRIDALDRTVSTQVQYDMLTHVQRVLVRSVYWFLRPGFSVQVPMMEVIARFSDSITILMDNMGEVVGPGGLERIRLRKENLVQSSVPEDLAQLVSQASYLPSGFDIIEIVTRKNTDPLQTACVHFVVGEHFGFDWLLREFRTLPGDSHWHALASAAVMDDVVRSHVILSEQIVRCDGVDATGRIHSWTELNRHRAQHVQDVFTDLRGQANLDFAMLTVAARELRMLAEREN